MDKTQLLDAIYDVHGGVSLWKSLSVARAKIVTGGNLWPMKGLLQDSSARDMAVWLHEQRASVMPFGASDQFTDYSPGRIAILKSPNQVIAERLLPRQNFFGHVATTKWDPLDRAYFNGYALWAYMNMPFQFLFEGVQLEMMEPWQEAGESWYQLKVTFPETIATHSSEQHFFFGQDFLLRRHDYVVDICGGLPASQYILEYNKDAELKLPSKRRAYRRSVANQPIFDDLLVSLDLSDFQFD